jgi:hypothetical protein
MPTILPFEAYNRPIELIGHRLGRAPWIMAIATNFGIGAHNPRNRSTVGKWLVLRPEFSAQAPNATDGVIRATRREAWVTGSDCGAGAGLLTALSHRPKGWQRSYLIEARRF